MSAQATSSRPLVDEELREEIELLTDVIVAASEYDKHLTSQQVDAALDLPGLSLTER
jgi:hypothetical protein